MYRRKRSTGSDKCGGIGDTRVFLLYMLGTPLALNWYWGFLALAAMSPFLLWRLLDEERILTRDLPGTRIYRQRVRHRLVPRV